MGFLPVYTESTDGKRALQVKADNNTTVLASYTYGDSNVRLITDESGYRTYYATNGRTVIAEYSETPVLPTTPKWSKSYVYLGGRLLSTLIPNGSGGEAVNYHHPDRLGTRLVTDPVAGTSFEQVTLPFGTPLDAESTGATNRRFTSYDRSNTTGLDYAVNRHYDAQQGRFTQVDPAGMAATSSVNPQSLNLYAYCTSDPINRTDADGLGLISALKRAFKKIIRAFVHAVVAGVIAFVMSGFNLGAAVAVFASDFLMQLGWQSKGYWHNQSGTPPTFPVSGVTLSQIFQGTVLAKLFPSPQDFLRFVIPFQGYPTRGYAADAQGLSPCVQKLLGPWFKEINLAKIIIRRGLPFYVRRDATAYTEGRQIYFRDGVDEHSSAGIALIGHEITHVRQELRYLFTFPARYARAAAREWRAGRDPAGYGNPFEKEAYDMEKAIGDSLDKNFGGKNPCP